MGETFPYYNSGRMIMIGSWMKPHLHVNNLILMKILLINQAFVSPEEPGHTRHYELAQFLRNMGMNWSSWAVISTIRPASGSFSIKVLRRAGYGWSAASSEHILYPALHHSYFWRILSFISFMVSSVIVSMRVKDVDLVMGTTPPIFRRYPSG